MRRFTLLHFGFLALLLLYCGCNLFQSSRIPEKKFIDYYTDMIIAQDSLGRDPATTRKIQGILNQKYAVTPEQYKATIDFYNDEPRRWDAFFDSVNSRVRGRLQPAASKP